MKPHLDIHQTITDSIVAAIEDCTGNPTLPWHRSGMATLLPTNPSTQNAYAGINIVSLWVAAEVRNYHHSLWASFKQWQSLGAQVRAGEKSSPIVFYKQFSVDPNPEDDADDGTRRVARWSPVFNVAQVDGYSVDAIPQPPPLKRNARADAFIAATKADIRHGGEQAFYKPSTDHIQMPDEWRFQSTETRTEDYYTVLFHELAGHWTSPAHRCNRQLGKRFADDAYCMDELVAELASAFTCAELGLSPRPRDDHAPYIAHWLRVLKADNRAIFTAAAKASEAVRYLHSLQPKA